jgi:hypothetical protein
MRGVRAPREAAGVARALTMSFDLRGVKPDDVIGLFSRGEPQSPIMSPDMPPRNPARIPLRAGFISKGPARATLTSRIRIPRYAFVGPAGLWGPALYVDGGAPAILPVPGLLPAPSKLLQWSSYRQQSLA